MLKTSQHLILIVNIFLITGLLFNCGNDLTVAPNLRKYGYEEESIETLNEYEINFQYIF